MRPHAGCADLPAGAHGTRLKPAASAPVVARTGRTPNVLPAAGGRLMRSGITSSSRTSSGRWMSRLWSSRDIDRRHEDRRQKTEVRSQRTVGEELADGRWQHQPDNAVMESFWSRLEPEWLRPHQARKERGSDFSNCYCIETQTSDPRRINIGPLAAPQTTPSALARNLYPNTLRLRFMACWERWSWILGSWSRCHPEPG